MNETEYSSLSSAEGKYVPIPAGGNHYSTYPGSLRTVINAPELGSDTVLIRTGGNALQAVSRQTTDQQGIMAVSVPEGLQPGDSLLARTPDGSRVVSAIVPKGVLFGHTFLVQIPPKVDEEKAQAPIAVVGVPVDGDLMNMPMQNHYGGRTQVVAGQDIEATELCLVKETQQPQYQYQQQNHAQVELMPTPMPPPAAAPRNNRNTSNDDPNLVLIKVPAGAGPGEKIRVRVPDGRTVEATVPPGNLTEFYLRLPNKKQNWHNNPLAVAPMTLGPLLL